MPDLLRESVSSRERIDLGIYFLTQKQVTSGIVRLPLVLQVQPGTDPIVVEQVKQEGFKHNS